MRETEKPSDNIASDRNEKDWNEALRRIQQEASSKTGELVLRGLKINTLPDTIAGCSHITHLNIEVNFLSSLEGLEHCPNLQTLICSLNSLTSLEGLAVFTKLSELRCEFMTIKHGVDQVLLLPKIVNLHTHSSKLWGFPKEILSQSSNDNCLPRLKAFSSALDAGSVPARQVKLYLLGNGKAGKTQLQRSLCGLPFDKDWDSTHGVDKSATSLSDMDGSQYDFDIWDFGGQEIYHGTHSLFLSDPSIFIIVWHAGLENGQTHDAYGEISRNQPLQYWLDYAAQFGGDDSQILIVKTHCDAGDTSVPPHINIPDTLNGRVKCLSIDNEARSHVRDLHHTIKEAGVKIVQTTGMTRLPTQWVDIGQILKEKPQTLLPRDEFSDICENHALGSDLQIGQETLLQFLDGRGDVIYKPESFDNNIILDPNWALQAIYTVYERSGNFAAFLRGNAGRFSQEQLKLFHPNWSNFSESDQKALLGFMQSSGMIFEHHENKAPEKTNYIAPDFLPDTPYPTVERSWQEGGEVTLLREWKTPMLHDGLIRSILSRLGTIAKDRGNYWRDGMQFFDKTSQRRYRIERVMDKTGWSGSIKLSVQHHADVIVKDDPNEYLNQVIEKELARFGVSYDAHDRQDSQHYPHQRESFASVPVDPNKDPTERIRFYVSYARNDKNNASREDYVDEFMILAESAGLDVMRDKIDIEDGARWTDFIEKMGQKKAYIFALMDDKYHVSEHCTYELTRAWESAAKHAMQFGEKVKAFYIDRKLFEPIHWRHTLRAHWTDQVKAFAANRPGDQIPANETKQLNKLAQIRDNYPIAIETLQETHDANFRDDETFSEYAERAIKFAKAKLETEL